MRNAIIGTIIGVVIGVVIGATVIAPRLAPIEGGTAGTAEAPVSAAPRPEAPSTAPAHAEAAARAVNWKIASAYPSSMPHFGSQAKRLERELLRVSASGIEVKLYDPGALVPAHGLFDAVASGAIDAALASPVLWAKKEPALELFGAHPFGPTAEAYLSWFHFGGGRKFHEALYAKHGLHGVPCGAVVAEAAGWFRGEINTAEDFKGLRIRIDGLGGQVLARLGAEPAPLSTGDTFMALETGELDAAAFSLPSVDLRLGFHEMARHYYFPGWHRPVTMLDLIVNKDRWKALTPVEKAQIETVCGDNLRHGLAESAAAQFQAMKELMAKRVKIRRWPDPVLEALQRAWAEVAQENATGDPQFRQVWDSLQAFREDYRIWNELGRP